MKIVAAIPVHSLKKSLSLIRKANKKADLIELRLDYAKKLDEKDLQKLISSASKPVIATNRPKKEGGFFSGKENERISILESAISIGVEYVDIEFSSGKKAISELIKKKGLTKLILSHHDFKKTPSFSELKKLLKKMASLKPDIVKIICFAKSEKDNETMVLLIEEAHKMKIDIIAFCMGEKGKYSRMHSCDYGACFTFASISNEKKTAEGQFTIEEMRSYREEFA